MELRHDLRLRIQCPVTYSKSNADKPAAAKGTVVNLSTGGWQVAGTDAMPRGAPLLLSIELPDGQDPLEVQLATVRWTAGTTFGVKNMILGEEEWKRLRRFVVDQASKADFSPYPKR